METKANYLLIGAFSLAGFLGIMAFVLWFANLQLGRQFAHYDVYFQDASGLSVSSDVRFAGLSVGRVIDMSLSDSDDGAVRVRLEVPEGTPVRTTSTAGRTPQGVTGTFAVAITSGTPDAPLLRAGAGGGVPIIPTSRSVLQTLSDEGPEMIKRLGEVTEDLSTLLGPDNQKRVQNILENVERSTGNLDKALADVSTATTAISSAAGNFADFGTRLESLGAAAEVTLSNADTALATLGESARRADGFMTSGQAAFDEVQGYVATDLRSLTTQAERTAATLDTSLGNLDVAMEAAKRTLGAAERTLDSADRVIGTEVAPVASDLRETLGHLNTAIVKVTDDLPAITGELRGAAQSASSAFTSLQSMVEGLYSPAQAFAREGLPGFTRVAVDMRRLIANIDQLVTGLRRNPSQILSGQRAPEFRR